MYNYTIHCPSPMMRPNADEEETINPSHVTAWDEACSLPPRLYPTQFGTAALEVDWRPVRSNVRNWYTSSTDLPDVAFVEISVHSKDSQLSDTIARELALIYLCDFFITMNIAAPGCCSLPLSGIRAGIAGPERLYGDIFDSAWIDSIRSGWPPITKISVTRVWDWLSTFRGTSHLLAESPAERALFCLLHIGANAGIGPESLIWIAHAFEALYGGPSPPLEILRGRVAGFLKLPEDSLAMLQKGLRHFYDLRNAFAHGGFRIPHLISNELLDPKIEEQRLGILDSCDFVLRLVVSTLQEFARANLQGLRFREIPIAVPCREGN